MTTIRSYLGITGLTDVGYQFFLQNVAVTTRITAGIAEEGEGWYSASGINLIGDNVRWDSISEPNARAREDLILKLMLNEIPTAIEIRQEIDSNSTQLKKIERTLERRNLQRSNNCIPREEVESRCDGGMAIEHIVR